MAVQGVVVWAVIVGVILEVTVAGTVVVLSVGNSGSGGISSDVTSVFTYTLASEVDLNFNIATSSAPYVTLRT